MISRKADELSSQCGYSFCPSTCLLDRGQHISYLDWILFRKRLRYTLEMTKWKSAAYMDTMQELIPFTAGDIVKLPCLLIYMKLTAHIITAFLPVSTKSLKRAFLKTLVFTPFCRSGFWTKQILREEFLCENRYAQPHTCYRTATHCYSITTNCYSLTTPPLCYRGIHTTINVT